MKYYAFLDENNIVTKVIPGKDGAAPDGYYSWEHFYGETAGMRCLETSIDGDFRGLFAGPGFSFIDEMGIFMPPKPYDSWITRGDTVEWVAPKMMPDDGSDYIWNEENLSWDAA